ncbi:uncharacterized protein LMH87_008524 [Akanthomyces muscarius]|uniref:Uncharacterized protein n=1 Tax=Akanthomyces muscarius TaxID=2231603 RepID=A0A9W8QH19_AKAMU|nr:uncharacterized protein LMH87_008524 [Akanthomyces muscarius]KAJ4157977.1 hypothetical protein LMH87_008524 [Akanthomyces muscarius]
MNVKSNGEVGRVSFKQFRNLQLRELLLDILGEAWTIWDQGKGSFYIILLKLHRLAYSLAHRSWIGIQQHL